MEVDCYVNHLKETDQDNDNEKENLEGVTTDHNETSSSKAVDNLTVGQPVKVAAKQAREKILNWSIDDQV